MLLIFLKHEWLICKNNILTDDDERKKSACKLYWKQLKRFKSNGNTAIFSQLRKIEISARFPVCNSNLCIDSKMLYSL
jgi:hypothetical protein